MTHIAVSGHRGLRPDVEAIVDHAVRTELAKYASTPLVGISCLADGADQIFARAVLETGGTLEVVVPAQRYRDALPENAHHEYDALLRRAATITYLDHVDSTSESHMDASIEMLKRADLLLAIWDGLPARSFGGTADVVTHARHSGVPVVVIWPEGARRD
jgi:hypothetical protein